MRHTACDRESAALLVQFVVSIDPPLDQRVKYHAESGGKEKTKYKIEERIGGHMQRWELQPSHMLRVWHQIGC